MTFSTACCTGSASSGCASSSTDAPSAGHGSSARPAGTRALHSTREELLDALERRDQAVDLLLGVVEVEARAGRARQPELAHQRLVAVVAAAEGDAILVGEGHDILRVDAFEGETYQAAALGALL